jgi:hypothetical protein
MLAYIFWHWTRSPASEYEAALVGFHRELEGLQVPGLQATASYRIQGATWAGEGLAYEDWYLVGGSADLDVLNEAAVSRPIRPAHDRPAHLAEGGAGGLYRLQSGEPDLDAAEVAWIAKPPGLAYEDFYSGLPPLRALFRRQMVLGPTPEFCAFGARDLDGRLVRRERLV